MRDGGAVSRGGFRLIFCFGPIFSLLAGGHSKAGGGAPHNAPFGGAEVGFLVAAFLSWICAAAVLQTSL